MFVFSLDTEISGVLASKHRRLAPSEDDDDDDDEEDEMLMKRSKKLSSAANASAVHFPTTTALVPDGQVPKS
jgi:hypothetical protein